MKTYSKGWLLAFVMILCSVLTGQAHATHARFGHFTWEPRPDISPTTVDFRLVVAFRRSYFGNLQLGSNFSPASFSFGDGQSANYQFEVIAMNTQEDWVIGRAYQSGGDPGVVRHTYATPTKSNGEPWQASMSVCCRISSLRNSADSNFQVITRVDLTKSNHSPVSSLPPIVSCPRGNCRFSIPVLDKDGDRIRWSLTNLSQSGIRQNPAGLTVDADTGFVDWTSGSATAALGLYALSVTMEDLDTQGNAKSSVVTDFIINLQDFVNNQPPTFNRPPSPESNATITAIVGQELVINLQATDSDLNDQVFLNNLELPTGATFESVTQGNPSSARLRWAPQMKDIGDYLVTFTATDQKAASALPLPVVIKVIKPAISDVRITDRVSAVDIDLDHSSFSVAPTDLRVEGDKSILEWRYASFDVGQVENLNFDLQLQNLLPGETRLVIHDLEMTYKDVNGNPVTEQLGSRTVSVAETVLTLATATDKIQYKPQETVIIRSQLANLDEAPASGSVDLSIQDTQGGLVQTLGSFDADLAASESRELSGKNFAVGNTLAGDYKVLAQLRNSAGKIVATAEAPFRVVTENGTAMSLVSAVNADKPVYGGWDNVALLARLQNAASNALVGASNSEIRVIAPDGTEILHDNRTLSSLAANAVQDFNFYLQLNDAAPGTYQVRWTTYSADGQSVLAQSQTSFAVERALAQSITGSVSVAASQIFHTGSNSCSYRIENRSATATGDVEYAYSLIHLDSEQVVEHQSLTTDLAAHAHQEWQQNISASSLKYGGYGCILEANLDGRWQVVASAGFEVQAPKIESTLKLGNRGRVLVLADEPRQCSALEDIRFSLDFGAELAGASKVEVKLYDQNRKLLDTQVVSAFDVELNSSIANSDADLAVNASASGQIQALVKAGAAAKLGGRYLVEVSVTKALFVKTTKEWSIDTTCDRPFTLGELYEDVRLLAYHPWLGTDDLRTADPYGPLNAPDVEEQTAFLISLLEEAGWEYTLVHDASAFTQAHRSGGYDVYALLSERPMLPLLVQKEVREAVFNGAGLVMAGAFDKRNLWVEPALGVNVVGRHPWARELSLQSSALSQAWTAPLPVQDWVFGAYLQGAQQVGEYKLVGDDLLSQWSWLDQGGFSLTDLLNFKRRAVTSYNYGKGHSVFVGFDLLLQATQAGNDSAYADLLRNALNGVHPTQLSNAQAAVVPLQIRLNNLRGATTGRAILSLPEGAQLVVPDHFQQVDGQWAWDFAVAEQDEIASRVYVRLPTAGSKATFDLAVATDIDHQFLQQPGASLELGISALPAAAATLEQLDQLAWRYWYRLGYRDAYYKFKLAQDAMAKSDWLGAQIWLITTANLLMFDSEDDVKAVRWLVDQHIRQVSLQLNAQ